MTSCSNKPSDFTDIPKQVVYSLIVDKNPYTEQIFIKDLVTGKITQLTNSGSNGSPSWSSDGSKILFASFTKENLGDIYIMDKDGSNKKPVVNSPANEREADLSPDENEVVFISDKDGNDEIYKINLNTKKVTRLSNSVLDEAFPKWSPSGNSIVFVSIVDGGRTQVYTMNANGENLKELTKFTLESFDRDPIWCPDESCVIFTRWTSDKLIRLELSTGESSFLLDGTDFSSKKQGFPNLSPVSGFVTFYIFDNDESYAINMETKEVIPLGIGAVNLMLYP